MAEISEEEESDVHGPNLAGWGSVALHQDS